MIRLELLGPEGVGVGGGIDALMIVQPPFTIFYKPFHVWGVMTCISDSLCRASDVCV